MARPTSYTTKAAGNVIDATHVNLLQTDVGLIDSALATAEASIPFVVVGNGTNQTVALRTALESARDSTTRKTVLILGTILVDPHPFDATNANAIVLYDGCALIGRGWSSCLTFRPDTMTVANTAWFMLRHKTRTLMANFRIDGNNAAMVKTAWTSVSCCGTYADDSQVTTNVTFDTLWIHNLPGTGNKEGFGIFTGLNSDNMVFHNVEAFDNIGTGLASSGAHVDPSLAGTSYFTRGRLHTFVNCRVRNNTWMGVSIDGTNDAKLYDCQAWNNGDTGYNMEYSTVILEGCSAWGNTNYGMRTYGPSVVRAWGWRSYANLQAEVALEIGPEAPAVQHGPNVDFKAQGSISLYGPSITPNTGVPHVKHLLVPAPTVGRSVHDGLWTDAPDAHAWTYGISATTGVQNQSIGSRLAGLALGVPLQTGPMSTGWYIGTPASGTTTAYVGGGNLGPNPFTLATTAAFNTWNSDAIVPLKAKTTYLVRGRVKVLGAKTWNLQRWSGGFLVVMKIPATAADVGQWFSFDVIVTTTVAGRLIFDSADATTNSLVVDYIMMIPIGGLPGAGE